MRWRRRQSGSYLLMDGAKELARVGRQVQCGRWFVWIGEDEFPSDAFGTAWEAKRRAEDIVKRHPQEVQS